MLFNYKKKFYLEKDELIDLDDSIEDDYIEKNNVKE